MKRILLRIALYTSGLCVTAIIVFTPDNGPALWLWLIGGLTIVCCLCRVGLDHHDHREKWDRFFSDQCELAELGLLDPVEGSEVDSVDRREEARQRVPSSRTTEPWEKEDHSCQTR